MGRPVPKRRYLNETYNDSTKASGFFMPSKFLEYLKNCYRPLGFESSQHMVTEILSMIIRPPENEKDEYDMIGLMRQKMPTIIKKIETIMEEELGGQQLVLSSGKMGTEKLSTVFIKEPEKIVDNKDENPYDVLRKCFYINLDLKGAVLAECFLNTKRGRPVVSKYINDYEGNEVGNILTQKDIDADLNSVVINLIIKGHRTPFHAWTVQGFSPSPVFVMDQAHALTPIIEETPTREQIPNWQDKQGVIEMIVEQYEDIETICPEINNTDLWDYIQEAKKSEDKRPLYSLIEKQIEKRLGTAIAMSQIFENIYQLEFSDNPNFPVELNAAVQEPVMNEPILANQNIYANLTQFDCWYREEEDEDENDQP